MKNVEKNLQILQNALIQIRVSTGECDRMARQCDSKQRTLEEKMIRVLGKMESELSRSRVVVTNESFIERLTQLQRAVSLPAYPYGLL